MARNVNSTQQRQNVFVTQYRGPEEQSDSVFVNELLSSDIETVRSTFVVKEASGAYKARQELLMKKQDYEAKMLACKTKEKDLRMRQLQIEEKVNKFDKFIKETETKRRRALEKHQVEKRLNEMKTRELKIHREELEKLRQKLRQLQRKVEKLSVYEKYLMKVAQLSPEDYFDNTSDSVLLGIMARYNTLYTMQNFVSLAQNEKSKEIESYQHIIQNAKQQHYQEIMVDNSNIARLQNQLEDLTHINAHLEHVLQTNENFYLQQQTVLGQVKLAVLNLAEKCTKKNNASLVDLDIFQMLTIIEEFLREQQDIFIMARNMQTSELLASMKQSENSDGETSLTNRCMTRASISSAMSPPF